MYKRQLGIACGGARERERKVKLMFWTVSCSFRYRTSWLAVQKLAVYFAILNNNKRARSFYAMGEEAVYAHRS